MVDTIEHLDDENFQNTINEGVTLVDFFADWCGPCRMITPVIEELATEYNGRARIGKLDIEAAQTTTAKFNVTSIPTLILFKDGEEVGRVVGVKGKEALKQMIESAL